MASFNQDQVRHFREVFARYSNEESEGISDRDKYVQAVNNSLEQCSLPQSPSADVLLEEYDRLVVSTGILSWQQFFQVLIHINLNGGVSVRLSVIREHSQTAEPPPPPRSESLPQSQIQMSVTEEHFQTPEPPPSPRRVSLPSGRVQFSTAEPPPYIPDNRSVFTHTLRRVGNVVGDFFGVTQASQHGTLDRIGWEEFTERRVEDNYNTGGLVSTLTRHASLIHGSSSQRIRSASEPPPPDYPSIADGRSFNIDDVSDGSDDNGAFITQAPPDYLAVTSGLPVGGISADTLVMPNTQAGVARITSFDGINQIREQQVYPAATRPSDVDITVIDQAAPTLPPRDELIFDKKVAWDHYQKFIKAEKKLRRRRVQYDAQEFFGDASAGQGGIEQHQSSIRRDRLSSLDPAAEPVQRRRKKKKATKLQRQSTLIRTEVERLPTFWPVCTVLVTLAQVVGMIVLLPLFGIAPIDVFSRPITGEFPSLNLTTTANVTYYQGVNLWIGPSASHLIQFGAKFTPCMRTDFGIRRRNARIYDVTTGCCKNQEWVGTVSIRECGAVNILKLNATLNATLSDGPQSNGTGIGYEFNQVCSSNESEYSPPNFHPCCVSITGLCLVMDFRQCEARGGYFHLEADTCQQVNCFRDVCGFNEVGIGEEGEDGLQPTAQQFWRWFTSIFLHLGVIHLIVYMPIQLYVGIKIERTIGWLRIGIIYILSGVGGNIVSAVFIPYGVNCGVGGAVFGLLGVLFVELFQFWQIVDRAWLELLKLTGFVVFLLSLGTLPFIDNMAHIGGLLFGVPSAIIFLPYITFGKWDAARKRLLLIICVPLVIALFLAGFFTFYFIPDPSFCSFCHYINCVPYAQGFCPEEYNNPNPAVFAL